MFTEAEEEGGERGVTVGTTATARGRGSRGGIRRSKGGKESGGRVPKGYGV